MRLSINGVTRLTLLVAMVTVVWLSVAELAVGRGGGGPAFTEDFLLEDCRWSARGGNAYFSLRPGYQLLLEGEEDGEIVTVLITVLRRTRLITFDYDGVELTVRTRVIEEREWVDGELIEVSRNFYARCRQTNAIYYFGEEVDDYEDCEIVSNEGAWLSGVDGAVPGLFMPAVFTLGSRYFQEIAPGVALDRAEHVDMGLVAETDAGVFDDCILIEETTPLDPEEVSYKSYCPGVGLVEDDVVSLVDFGFDIMAREGCE